MLFSPNCVTADDLHLNLKSPMEIDQNEAMSEKSSCRVKIRVSEPKCLTERTGASPKLNKLCLRPADQSWLTRKHKPKATESEMETAPAVSSTSHVSLMIRQISDRAAAAGDAAFRSRSSSAIKNNLRASLTEVQPIPRSREATGIQAIPSYQQASTGIQPIPRSRQAMEIQPIPRFRQASTEIQAIPSYQQASTEIQQNPSSRQAMEIQPIPRSQQQASTGDLPYRPGVTHPRFIREMPPSPTPGREDGIGDCPPIERTLRGDSGSKTAKSFDVTTKKKPTEKKPTEKKPTEKKPTEKESTEKEPAKKEPTEKEPAKKEPTKKEPAKKEPAKKEPAKKEPAKKEPTKKEPTEKEPAKKEPTEKDSRHSKPESRKTFPVDRQQMSCEVQQAHVDDEKYIQQELWLANLLKQKYFETSTKQASSNPNKHVEKCMIKYNTLRLSKSKYTVPVDKTHWSKLQCCNGGKRKTVGTSVGKQKDNKGASSKGETHTPASAIHSKHLARKDTFRATCKEYIERVASVVIVVGLILVIKLFITALYPIIKERYFPPPKRSNIVYECLSWAVVGVLQQLGFI